MSKVIDFRTARERILWKRAMELVKQINAPKGAA